MQRDLVFTRLRFSVFDIFATTQIQWNYVCGAQSINFCFILMDTVHREVFLVQLGH